LTEDKKHKGIATACSEPPVCWARAIWVQLLADHLVSIDMVDSISDETLRQTKKKRLSQAMAKATPHRAPNS